MSWLGKVSSLFLCTNLAIWLPRRSPLRIHKLLDPRWNSTPSLLLQRPIVCRDTTCYRAKPVKSKSQSWNYVVKLRSVRRIDQEGEGRGVAKLVAHHDLISIAKLRTGLTF